MAWTKEELAMRVPVILFQMLLMDHCPCSMKIGDFLILEEIAQIAVATQDSTGRTKGSSFPCFELLLPF